jgi:uncharacterized UPF0146 family protein
LLQKPLVNIVIISISNPIKIGVYKDNILYEEIERSGLTSDILDDIFKNLLNIYDVKSIVYSNGPGSYMSTKLVYIFIKTLSIVKNIEILAVDGFYFNGNKPIKAIGNSFFVKENGKISIKNSMQTGKFEFPINFNKNDFHKDIEPIYILEAV